MVTLEALRTAGGDVRWCGPWEIVLQFLRKLRAAASDAVVHVGYFRRT